MGRNFAVFLKVSINVFDHHHCRIHHHADLALTYTAFMYTLYSAVFCVLAIKRSRLVPLGTVPRAKRPDDGTR